MSRIPRVLARAARLAPSAPGAGHSVLPASGSAAPARTGPGTGRLAALAATGAALLGGVALLVRRVGSPGAGPAVGPGNDSASEGRNLRGHVDPRIGHAEHQDWDYGEHGPETGRGRPSIPASDESRAAGHETEDVSTRNIHRVMVLFAAVALGAVFGMMALLAMWRADDRAASPRLTAVQVAPVPVPGPHLQVNAYSDLDHERGREIGKLSGWAYTDDSRTEARMPIEDAMALVAGRPLDTPGLTRPDARGRPRPGPNPDVTQETPLGTGPAAASRTSR